MDNINLYWDYDYDPHNYIRFTNGFKKQDIYKYLENTFDNQFLNVFKETDGIQKLFYNLDTGSDITNKYYYPLALHWWLDWNNSENFWFDKFLLNKKIYDDIINNYCKILFYNLSEGWGEGRWIKYINLICKKYSKLSKNNFIIICNNSSIKNIQSIPYNYKQTCEQDPGKYDTFDLLHKDIINDINLFKPRDYKFVLLNRRPNPGRFVVLTEMFKDKDLGILSFGCDEFVDNTHQPINFFSNEYKKYVQASFNDNQHFNTNILKKFQVHYKNIYNEYVKKNIQKHLPIIIDDGIDPTTNPLSDPSIEKFTNSYLHIITETYIENEKNMLNLSEKTFKPIWYLQPFIIIGQTGSLKYLKQLGYKTFDKFIDESYDSIINNEERIVTAIQSAKNFYNSKYILYKLKAMLPILIHNYKTLNKNINSLEPNLKQKLL